MASQRQAQRAAEQNADDLSTYPNVVGVGVQPLDLSEGGAVERRHAVAVYVARVVPRDQLAPHEQLPEYVEIPGRGEPVRVPVKVVESGSFAPEVETGSEGDDASSDGAAPRPDEPSK